MTFLDSGTWRWVKEEAKSQPGLKWEAKEGNRRCRPIIIKQALRDIWDNNMSLLSNFREAWPGLRWKVKERKQEMSPIIIIGSTRHSSHGIRGWIGQIGDELTQVLLEEAGPCQYNIICVKRLAWKWGRVDPGSVGVCSVEYPLCEEIGLKMGTSWRSESEREYSLF